MRKGKGKTHHSIPKLSIVQNHALTLSSHHLNLLLGSLVFLGCNRGRKGSQPQKKKRRKQKQKQKTKEKRTKELSKFGLKGLIVVLTSQEEEIRLAHVGVEQFLGTISLVWLLLLVLLNRIKGLKQDWTFRKKNKKKKQEE